MKLIKKIYLKSKLRTAKQKEFQRILCKMGVKMGDNCEIQRNVSFGSEPYLVELGNHVRVTEGCKFITHDGGVWVLRALYKEKNIDIFGKIKVGNNVHIGMNSIIMPGVQIGNDCVIGCGAIVTKNIPSGEIWAGVPARYIETVEEYHEKNKNRFEYHVKKMTDNQKEEYLINKYGIGEK